MQIPDTSLRQIMEDKCGHYTIGINSLKYSKVSSDLCSNQCMFCYTIRKLYSSHPPSFVFDLLKMFCFEDAIYQIRHIPKQLKTLYTVGVFRLISRNRSGISLRELMIEILKKI
jgi:hypothetical protein